MSLRKFREDRKVSLRCLAQCARITPSHLSKVERGIVGLSELMAAKITDGYHLLLIHKGVRDMLKKAGGKKSGTKGTKSTSGGKLSTTKSAKGAGSKKKGTTGKPTKSGPAYPRGTGKK